MQWTDDIHIETPEQIDVALEAAGLGSRFLAYALDGLIKAVITILIGNFVLFVLAGYSVFMGNREDIIKLVGLLMLAIGFAIAMAHDIAFEVWNNGRTLGKMVAGLRVIRESGTPVNFSSSCIRNFLSMADFLPFFYLLGSLLILTSSRGQRLGDMAAGTLVIRERQPEVPFDPQEQIDKLASAEYTFTAQQLAACLPQDRYILRSFFQRYQQFDQRARLRLARRLAEELLLKTAYQPSAPVKKHGRLAVRFLASLYRDLENLAQQGR